MAEPLPFGALSGFRVEVSKYLCQTSYKWKPAYLLPLGKQLCFLVIEKCPGKAVRMDNLLLVCPHVKEELDRAVSKGEIEPYA